MTSAAAAIASDGAAVQARGLAKRFGAKEAVRPFDVDIEAGVVTGLLGPNGSGKSTFLRMLTGLVRPDRGAARVAGVELRGDGTAVRRRAAYLPGDTAVYREMKGAAHLRWLLRGRPPAALARATEVARALELPLGRAVRGYSHGMKRMLLVAATLGPDVPVRILDEPTEGLDPSKRAEVLALFAAEAAAGRAVLLSSHHLDEVDQICARLLFLNQGELLASESAEGLRERARRLIRIEWAAEVAAERFQARLAALGAAEVRPSGARASLLLAESDPRRFLAALAADRELPAPRAVVYGEMSLRELYRDLYGVAGI